MANIALIGSGLRFGLVLQLAIGPVCLLVLNTSTTHGFVATMPLVATVALVDALFIMLSMLGASTFLGKPKARQWAQRIGGLVLVLFGLDGLLSALGITLLSNLRVFSVQSNTVILWKGLLLTISNPLTILFWSGVLTAKVAELQWQRWQLFWFSIGCVLSTLLFLSLIALLGGTLLMQIPNLMITIMNGLVGIALIGYGVKLLMNKPIQSKL